MSTKEHIIEPTFEERKTDTGIVGTTSWCWKGDYFLSNESIERGFADQARKLYQRGLTEQLSGIIEKLFIEYIEQSKSDIFVSKHATKRTTILHPIEFGELLRIRDHREMRIAVPAEVDYNLYTKSPEVKVGWYSFEIGRELLNEIFEAVSKLYARGPFGTTIVLIPPNKLANTEEELKVLTHYDGTEMFSFAGHRMYVSLDVTKVIAISGGGDC